MQPADWHGPSGGRRILIVIIAIDVVQSGQDCQVGPEIGEYLEQAPQQASAT